MYRKYWLQLVLAVGLFAVLAMAPWRLGRGISIKAFVLLALGAFVLYGLPSLWQKWTRRR